jgi:hypothetical protein
VAVAAQVLLPPCPTGLGEQATVPPAVGLAVAVIAYEVCEKVAVTFRGAVTLVKVQAEPVQSPLKATNAYPALADAVHVLLPPCPTGFGEQVTVPPAIGLAVAVIA